MSHRQRWGAVALGLVLAAGPAATGVGQEAGERPGGEPPTGESLEDEEDVEEPLSAEELSLLARLEAARAAVARLQAASHEVEYLRARAEVETTEIYLDARRAGSSLDLVQAATEAALRSLDRTQQERQAAQSVLDMDAATSYKFNGARGTAMLFELLASSEDPNEFSRNMYALESVMVRQQQEVVRLVDELAVDTRRVETLMSVRDSAYRRYQATLRGVEEIEALAAELRVEAAEAEAQLLAAAGVALALELEAVDLQLVVPPPSPLAAVPAAGPASEIPPEESDLPPPPPDAPVDEPDGEITIDGADAPEVDFEAIRENIEMRLGWLDNRLAALEAEVALDPIHRRVRPELLCPVDGVTEFSNDWHYPRSHGRRHKGTDLMAERHTPVVAMADGVVTDVDAVDNYDGDTDLGGISVSYETSAGRFYAAHLESLDAELEVGDEIVAGQVLGTVGTSGNAAGTPPHLHFGWYVAEAEVNPYPTLALVCARAPEGREITAPVK